MKDGKAEELRDVLEEQAMEGVQAVEGDLEFDGEDGPYKIILQGVKDEIVESLDDFEERLKDA